LKGVELKPIEYVGISKWIDAPVPQRQWAVHNRIPARNVTVLSGTGGIGKTILAMQLAAAGVLPFRDWVRAVPDHGPVMFLSGEEPEEEMHRRFADIAEQYNVTYQELIDGGLRLIDMAGKDAMLARPNRNGALETTPFFSALLADAKQLKPKLVILDNRNMVYGGNINDPTQVSEFINALRGFAIEADTAILLILHPSMSGIAAGADNTRQGLAGAMNWHDLPRGRMFFNRFESDDKTELDKNLRVLSCKKNNYGPDDETVTLRWTTGTNGSGTFIVEASPGSLDAIAADHKADEMFLTTLQRLNDQNRGPFSHRKSSNNYAPKVFAALPEAKAAGITRSALDKALTRLAGANKIVVELYGPPSRQHSRLIIATGET
jgi:RecA-family ATPase